MLYFVRVLLYSSLQTIVVSITLWRFGSQMSLFVIIECNSLPLTIVSSGEVHLLKSGYKHFLCDSDEFSSIINLGC